MLDDNCKNIYQRLLSSKYLTNAQVKRTTLIEKNSIDFNHKKECDRLLTVIDENKNEK